jgi:hypothetical protein
MEVCFTRDLQMKLDKLVLETGRSADELVQDAMAGYVDELAEVRSTLDSRYDDLETGKVKLISGDEVKARLRAKSEARRAGHS